MKTKPAETILTAFPTCGEVFHYLIAALDLTAWADAFHDSTTKRRSSWEIKTLSDLLRDWATEAEGRTPSREELVKFICDQIKDLPRSGELAFVLTSLWNRVLDEYATAVRENATFLDRNRTRDWYAQMQAPGTLYFLWALQKLFRRVAKSKGPMLDTPLDDLLAKVWVDAGEEHTPSEYPLHLDCYKYYAELRTEDSCSVDPKTFAAWKSGEKRPSFDAVGRHFSRFPDKLGMVLNFAFAGLLGMLAKTLRTRIAPKDWPECRRLLLNQAICVHCLDETVTANLTGTPYMSLPDYERLLAGCLGDYMEFLMILPQSGVDALDLSVARFHVYIDYQNRFGAPEMPATLAEFCGRLDDLWRGTSLKDFRLNKPAVVAEMTKLRTEHSDFCEALAGPLLAIEARLALCHEPTTEESLQRAFRLYQKAFSASRYQAGAYTKRIAQESLGLAALLHRRETGEGAIKPWIKNVLTWWDLLGLGIEFDHERLEQRIELAESRFTDGLNSELRDRLKSALPQLGLTHRNIGGPIGFADPGLIEELRATPIDPRQRKPMSPTIVGRDQTPLMEAIDREHLDEARELVRKGADLNFINSTGDTCVTKAFARKYYDLVLEILRRDNEPIRRETLLRVTNKNRISGLEQTLSLGRVEILRELCVWKQGRGDVIDMNRERVWEQAPLYYEINCLARYRASASEAVQQARGFMTDALANALSAEVLKSAHEHLAKEYNPKGVLACIDYLVKELRVDLDAPNPCDNSALTLAAEARLLDVAAVLLAAGANVNHRFQGGGTALVLAIINDDYEMTKLLLEYCADYRLFVDALGRPIYAMNMSEKIRQLIPFRI